MKWICHNNIKRSILMMGGQKDLQKGELQLTYIPTMVEIDLWNKNMLKLHVGYM